MAVAWRIYTSKETYKKKIHNKHLAVKLEMKNTMSLFHYQMRQKNILMITSSLPTASKS